MSVWKNAAEYIRGLSKTLDRPIGTLIALTTTNDPFHASTPGRVERAQWFTDLYKRLRVKVGSHIRRIHYLLISQEMPITMLDGTEYENTMRCWQAMKEACRDARYLNLVDPADFEDHRNKETIVNLRSERRSPELDITNSDTGGTAMPSLPKLEFYAPTIPQRYHIEIVIEKSTVDDIVGPIADRHGINTTACVGEVSLKRCEQIVRRARQSGMPVRILYISDFDRVGDQMPVSAARKIEFLLWRDNLDLDIELRQIMLTEEQCQQYRLPRTPLKDSDPGKARFEERYGEGGTELDALVALHPGELESILEDEIARYCDYGLDDAVEEIAGDIDSDLDDINEAVHSEFQPQIEELRAEYQALDERRKSLYQGFAMGARSLPRRHRMAGARLW
jgi:hypothetical protein